ncbi:MAG TPA: DUF4910 domain-containing protein [Thermodesulfobacteriaceae bacterium]|nr:DUF4910 domain-containing protein [Thermodesulfobacteriaceae bacterium]
MHGIQKNIRTLNLNTQSEEMYRQIEKLYPICRSITGDGVRKTLDILQEGIPLTKHEVETGTKVFDWKVPLEWNIRDAYLIDPDGEKIVDFKESNLHVLSYSSPIHRTVSLDELKQHLFSLPDHPDWIPYRTSYYSENWGFCIRHNQFEKLSEGDYEVFIDSSLEQGHLTYGEYVVEGQTDLEVLISTHICHPSLCNDNLSGNVVSAKLAEILTGLPLRYTYRFLFIPGTIGSITWLALNEPIASRIRHGLVAVCLGDAGRFTYKKSRQGNAEIDQVVAHVLKQSGYPFRIIDFFPFGYDERQYCSPGFNLPVGCLMRTPHGEFPEYHTSADNLDFVSPENLALSLSMYLQVVDVLESNSRFLNTNPKCEPKLGKRGLYGNIGGNYDSHTFQLAILWVLNQSDGENTLLDIARKSGLGFDLIKAAAAALSKTDLLKSGDNPG